MTPRETAGAVLRRWRLQAGLGLREFAASVGMAASYLSEIERGTRRPSWTRWTVLAFQIAPRERWGELLCELWAALDDRPWYRVDEVPPPVGNCIDGPWVMIRTEHYVDVAYWSDAAKCFLDQSGDSYRHAVTHWRPLGRGPAEMEEK